MSPSSSTNDKKLTNTVQDEQIKRELQNAHKYRKYYSELLAKHKGILKEVWRNSTTSSDSVINNHNNNNNINNLPTTKEENNLIRTMWKSEINAMGIGFVFGCCMMATIRFMTPILIRRIGGEEKIRAVRIADEEAKRMGTYKYQRAFAWIVEGSFSFWAANRVYHYQSKNSQGSYETLAKIPLVQGRSIIADNICDEWIHITTRRIPRSFWKNLEHNSNHKHGAILNDEQAWRAILQFSNNCVKRGAYERQIPKTSPNVQSAAAAATLTTDDGDDDDDDKNNKDNTHISLPTSVPNDVSLSETDLEEIIEDTPA